ncbi:uncharacterized protein MEPE_00111 [Melanopsichium pennsylvanicum]|uniref:Multiple myeloma tumor-associated protein 2-like N-terminal domain-containing protein n=1 Tax=Melanopsichium pennsylvanicum TaxID=63383 RepID=A0AAJ5C2D1_9BASI|nr:uncharacterized protein MEPE_00111 [Melanopsichium pennsylvanicum]
MYAPTRGGARGGAAEFSWDKVKESKDREFYLGNSVAAPTGRWQDGRDINWYNKDSSSSSNTLSAADERREELRRIKEAETAALYAKLGKPPPPTLGEVGQRLASGSAATVRREVTGPNSAPLSEVERKKWGDDGRSGLDEELSEADKKLARKFAKEEVRRRRVEAGEDDHDSAKHRSRRDGGRYRHSSRRHRDDPEDQHSHRAHKHHHQSRCHRDDKRDDKHSEQSRHRIERWNGRRRSRSPEPSSHRRHRSRDDESRSSKGLGSRHDREHRHNGSEHDSSSHRGSGRERERERERDRDISRHQSYHN